MGYYIPGPAKGKAKILVEQYGAKILAPLEVPCSFSEVPDDKAVIVLIDNGLFEAAALCYSSHEFEDLINYDIIDDPRPRRVMMMDKTMAYKLAGYNG